MSMVERVARAIDPYAFESWRRMYDHCIAAGDDEQTALKYADMSYLPTIERARTAARAAIEAMREPSEEMLTFGRYELETCLSDDPCGKPVEHLWGTMITAALEGE